jgi:hypothetical protein
VVTIAVMLVLVLVFVEVRIERLLLPRPARL